MTEERRYMLLTGASRLTATADRGRRRRGWGVTIASGGLASALLVAATAGLVPSTEAFSGFSWRVAAFFVVGAAALVALISLLSRWLDSDRGAAVRGRGYAGASRLALRNAARHRQRSVLTAGLIAAATFVIVAVAAAHRDPTAEKPEKK